MKKIKKIGIIISMVLVLSGCGSSKELKAAYNKMEIGKEITGYKVDYRLYGTYQGKTVNDIVRIQNVNGKVRVEDPLSLETDPLLNKEEKKIDEKVYQKPEKYIEGLKKAKEKKKREEKVAENTYTVYDIVVGKKTIKEIIQYTSVKELEVKEDVNAKVYIDKDGYVYRVIYELDMANKLYLNVSYFGFDKK